MNELILWPDERLKRRQEGRSTLESLEILRAKVLELNVPGLCTAQLGLPGRAIAVQAGGKVAVLENPKIVSTDLIKYPAKETNASLPGKVLSSRRHNRIKVKFKDRPGREGTFYVEEVSGQLSVTIQSLMDVLNGKFRV